MAAPSLSHLLHASNLPDTHQQQQQQQQQQHQQQQHHHHRPRIDTGRQPLTELPPPQPLTLGHGSGHSPIPGSTLPASSTVPGTLSTAASSPSHLYHPTISNIVTSVPSPQRYQYVTATTSSPALQVGSILGPGGVGAATGSAPGRTEVGDGAGSPSEATTTSSAVPPPPPLPPHSATSSGHTPNHTPSPGQKSHANNTSLYQCADCQRRYSRPEHLARHIQTHTLGKRFGCEVCGKLFARADLLKRHTLNHQSDNDNKKRRKTDPGAGRVSHACRPCATARVKCEEVKPCTRCRNRNLNCEYASSEAGSAAAMHLLHLSKAHSNAPSTPTSSMTTTTPHEQLHQQQQPSTSAAAATAAVAATSTLSASHHGSHEHYQTVHNDNHTPTPTSVTHAPAQPLSHSQNHRAHSPSHYLQQYQHRQTPSQHSSHLSLHAPVHDNSPMSTRHRTNPEESQLPTPDTVMEQNQEFNNPPQYANNENVIDMARLPFSDFLRDVLYEQSLDQSRMEEAQGLAVLDFCDDTNLELNDIDFGILDHWNLDNIAPSAAHIQTPRADDALDLSQMRQKVVKIWRASPWRWDPNKQDSGYQEQGNLAVPTDPQLSTSQLSTGQRFDRVVDEKLEQSGRDKILGTVLSTVKTNATLQRVTASFPNTDVFDTLIHFFLASHMCSVSEFIHFSSFELNRQWPEWLGIAAAAGAMLTPLQTLRKLGYALQEAVRLTMPTRFEDNNTSIQDLGAIQAFVLVQDFGLWSGNRRKMEIAECHLLIPITMMRYRGKFQRSKYPVSTVEPSDEGEVLEEKWRKWSELESWKRLVFHAYIRDAQISMTTLTNPSMSYSELSLPLPEARELWCAKTAQEWKTQYLQRSAGHHKRPPSLGDLMRDMTLLSQNHNRLDVQFSISIFLHGFWSLILEYRQLNAVHRTQFFNSLSENSNMLLASRHQDLCKHLLSFQTMTADWQLGHSSNGVMSAQETLVLNLLLMNLYVSLDDLQLFSGKEGEEQARRIYPLLQRWATAPEARHTLWKAGQIIRQAKMFPPGHLKDFYAVAVHHAALALWTYGVVTKATRRQPPLPAHPPFQETIYLDCTNTAAAERYITTGQGRAVIRGPGGDNNNPPVEASMEDPRACMDIIQEVLRANFSNEPNSLPAIVENLCHLIKQLGNAAWAVGLG